MGLYMMCSLVLAFAISTLIYYKVKEHTGLMRLKSERQASSSSLP